MREWSPRTRARAAGLFGFLESGTWLFGQMVVPGMLIVASDAGATANNILANEAVYRLGIASALSAVVFHLAGALLFFDLLRVVHRRVAGFGLYLVFVYCALQAVTALLLFGPLVILRNPEPLGAFTTEQLKALALIFFRINRQAEYVYLAFFGVSLIAAGFLIFRSTFLPRFIGVGLMLEGLGWTAYMSPPVGVALFPAIVLFGLFGELSLGFWLLLRGVNEERWKAQAERSRLS